MVRSTTVFRKIQMLGWAERSRLQAIDFCGVGRNGPSCKKHLEVHGISWQFLGFHWLWCLNNLGASRHHWGAGSTLEAPKTHDEPHSVSSKNRASNLADVGWTIFNSSNVGCSCSLIMRQAFSKYYLILCWSFWFHGPMSVCISLTGCVTGWVKS